MNVFDFGFQVLDSDPEVIMSALYAQRIQRAYGRTPRFVAMLRDPVERALSQYEMYVAESSEPWANGVC